MTDRILTSGQIDNLFELCEFHNVHFYDVQIELVDHMASAIEALWKSNPELPFEEAAYIIGEQLGGKSGFESIKEVKKTELRKKYNHLQWKYIEEFFQLPKIILTLAITFALYFVFKHSHNDIMVSYCVQGFYILLLAIYLIFIYPKKFRLNIISGKSFLLYEQFRNIKRAAIGIGFSAFNIFQLIGKPNRLKFVLPFSGYLDLQLIAAFLITIFGIMIVALCVDSPQRLKEDFTREFPQFIMS